MNFLSVKQVAELLQTSDDTVLRLIREGILKSERIRPRGKHRIHTDDLEAYVKKQGVTLKKT